ncbi:CDC45 family [Hyaloraphidium curvatum]|nr:CDC45 family [Hyaloraphidium curvatum]
MPIVQPVDFARLYDQIRKDAVHNRDSPVIIFAANDVDALCAARILQALLAADQVKNTLIPVSGYTDLAAESAKHVENKAELRSIVTINCGGMVDLKEFFSLPSERVRVYVIDSHRPLNLQNLFGSPQICVLADDGFEEQLGDIHAAFDALEYGMEDEEESDGDSDSDSGDSASEREDGRDGDRSDRDGDGGEGDGDGEGGRSPRSPRTPRSERSHAEGGSSATGSPRGKRRRSDGSPRPPKKARTDSPRTARREMRQRLKEHRRAVAEYYSDGTSYSKSAAGLVYLLCQKLGRERSDLLWLAIVSLAYQFAHGLVALRSYLDEIERRFKPEALKFLGEQGSGAAADENSLPDSQIQPGSSGSDGRASGIYFTEREFRFAMFRHWNLYDSMQHSDYVCTKLGLWKDKGRKRMQSMLAEMGLPLTEVRQPPTEMNKRMRDELIGKFFAEGVADKYNLKDLLFPTFYRRYGVRGLRGELSASDMVFAIDALLDGGEGWARRDADGAMVVDEAVVGGVPENVGHNSVRAESRTWRDIVVQHTAITSGQKTGVASITRRRDGGFGVLMDDKSGLPADLRWKSNWYAAFDALEDIDHTLFGIHLSKHLQAAVLRCATTILDKGGVKTMRRFRLVRITTSSIGRIQAKDCTLLSRSAQWLNRVATVISKAFKEFSAKSDLPIVIVALNPTGETYLMAGYPAPSAKQTKNPFGLAFQECCQRTGARAKHDAFDTHVMEVKAEDLKLVVEALQKIDF